MRRQVPPQVKLIMTSFNDLKLIEPILQAVKSEGYDEPTPIQTQSIPHVLAGSDILGCAQTGTGKTAAFALPILQRLCTSRAPGAKRSIRALTLTPTRELAAQIGDSFTAYGRNTGLRCSVVFGGVSQRPQQEALHRGVDILVATPGRLLDLAYQGLIDFFALEVFVLDEADRMLDMGFIRDVDKIVSMLPAKRQTLFFSATMPPEIKRLADNILHDPVQVAVAPPCATVDLINQSVYFVERIDKPSLLTNLFKDRSMSRVLIFTRTKHGADKVARNLFRGRVNAMAIHGNKTQGARESALAAFKSGRIRALVATDIASRGIDVDNVTHVINYDLPNEPESYVHRIGRTGRAGASGEALSFCDTTERVFLADIEKLIKKHVARVGEHPFKSSVPPPPETNLEPRSNSQQGNRGARPQQRNSGGSRRGFRGQRGGSGQNSSQAGGQSSDQNQSRSQSGNRSGGSRPANNGPRRTANAKSGYGHPKDARS